MLSAENIIPIQPGDQLRFETLISELSVRFVGLLPGSVDDEINNALRELLDFFEGDRCGLLGVRDGERVISVTHAAYASGIERVDQDINLAELFPWSYEKLIVKREIVSFSRVSEMPKAAARDCQSWQEMGVKSSLDIPLVFAGRVSRLIVVESLRAERSWHEEFVTRLRLLGEVFANALERKDADCALRESEARLKLAAAAADAGLWTWEPVSGKLWVTDKLRELFGFSITEPVIFERFMDAIYPDDRAGVSNAIEQATRGGQPYETEFRITAADGSIRWISARGSMHREEPGGIERLMGACVDSTSHKQVESKIQEQLRFETVISDLSARFVVLPAEEVDSAIQQAQREIVEALDLDRSTLFQLATDTRMDVTHFWSRYEWPADPKDFQQHDLVWAHKKILAGEMISFSSLKDLPAEATGEVKWVQNYGTKSSAIFPLSDGGKVFGAVAFGTVREERDWPPAVLDRLRLAASVFASSLARARNDQKLRNALKEVQTLRDQLQRENVYLRREVKALHGHTDIVAESSAIRECLVQAQQVAPTVSTVLLLGETGTGKERFAVTIHELSPRRERAMVTVNCAAIPATLMESELFGHEKGAFTGATSQQPGKFELAHGSTIFLDEIGDLPIELQAKLLRVLQEKCHQRIGGTKVLHSDARIIAATNRDLEKEVREGTFREDLFYRLNVFPIKLPPLRERRDDIALLAWGFVEEFSQSMHKAIESISQASMKALLEHSWPGNVRELRNIIERAMILNEGDVLNIHLQPVATAAAKPISERAADVEKNHILEVLERTNWRVRGRGGAAELLDLKPTTLESRMARLGIRRTRGASETS